MLIKQVMLPSCTDSSEVEIQFEQRKYDTFFHKKILYGANVVYAEGWQQSKKEWHILPYFQQSFTE